MSGRTATAVLKAFGGLVPAWAVAGFVPRVRAGRLVFVCVACRVGIAFQVDRELGVRDRLLLQNHKTMHDLNLDPLGEALE